MRVIKSFLVLSLAIVLCSCPGNQNNPSGEKPTQQTKVQEQQYVEPSENIAQTIWEKLIERVPSIKRTVEAAQNYEGYRDTKPEPQYPSKTSMTFYHVGDEFDGDIYQLAFYQMQCYQMTDQSWIAVVYEYCIDESNEDEFRRSGLNYYYYKDGDLSPDLPDVDLPTECPQSIMHYKDSNPWPHCVVIFDNQGFEMTPHKFWPIRYDWTGEKFVMNPNSVVLSNDFMNDALEPYNFSRNNKNGLNFYDFKVDDLYGIYDGETGEKVLQLTFENSELSVVDILSPKIGIAFAEEEMEHYILYCRRPTSKPVALGQPIKNVLDSKKDKDIYNDITVSDQDGLYTLTQHLNVDKSLHKDIYAEYQAEDKDATIVRFRVFAIPLVITLESELAENTSISDETKQLWSLINSNNDVTGTIPGNFKNIWGARENSFAAIFRADYDNGGYAEWKMQFVMFKANDGRKLAYIQKTDYSHYKADTEVITPEWEEYIYNNGVLEKVEPQIPMPNLSDFPAYNNGDKTVTMEGGEIDLDDEGFWFLAHSDHYSSFGNQAPDSYLIYYRIYSRWNGETFVVPEFVEEEYDYEEIYEDDYEE